jgi:hypothetical protein
MKVISFKQKFFTLIILTLFVSGVSLAQESIDTSYSMIAPSSVQRMVVPGKAPFVTLQISGYYDVGLLDLAANDNAVFHQDDFINGRNFGTRYGYGFSITGKISLHKEGNMRLLVSSEYNRFQSNLVIGSSSSGKVGYNVFSEGVGVEDNFTPDKRFKPYVGIELLTNIINGSAVLGTDSSNFNLDIKTAVRLGFEVNLGFEYAFDNVVGLNLGMKLTHANVLLRESKQSPNSGQTYLNDEYSSVNIPYAGWKQFFFSSFYGGINFYFGMKNKK